MVLKSILAHQKTEKLSIKVDVNKSENRQTTSFICLGFFAKLGPAE